MNTTRSQLRHSTSTRVGGRTKPFVSSAYIVGLTDGEGCFYVLIKPPFNRNGGALVQLSFLIKIQEQDKELLEKVKNTLKCGAVYFQHENRPNHSQCYRYTINSHRDILGIIIPFFKRNILQSYSKRKNFEIFCEIADLVRLGAHHRKDGIEQIRSLKSQMNNRTRVVRESRSLRGNAKLSKLSQSARQAMEGGSS